ncbi:NACHT domain-containing NTPase [Nitrosospira sp. Nsp1]|uniref:NACHT domain-containing protein n=1 Tax=Nitrosospira sp. Nsp1 TaxID=136547 RepID=UPI00088EF679|nr:hypothetical protein [Nitrosospira sp. Nsp1]SCX37435.1 hypothetical protein SAMN05720354_101103 [Nitrosospira sp. Nsp1]
MTKPSHNWTRFWFPLGKSLPLDGLGFLHDPENEYAHFYYNDYQPRPLNQLTEIPVVILLGEPGIGKSTALKQESFRLQARGEAYLYKELNQYHDDTRLIGDVFDSEKLQAWRRGHHRLTLLLDSLDECSLTIRNVVRILASQLKVLPRDRLSLRLTCRTADWPAHFTDELRELWLSRSDAADPIGIFELAPLRQKDIMCAATDRGLDGKAFSNEVQLKEIQPLASHPNTLNMLFGLFGRSAGLPKQRSELYQLGCQMLADERNVFRKIESRHTGKLNARQRMAVAGRIAAQMVFGHRSTIWYGDAWEAETADLIERDILGNIEHADGQDFLLDSHAFRETIECALFSGRDNNRIGFAHQSYIEFLAAWYLHSHGLDTGRILPLLLHPDDSRIPPQYAETAIWLAALDGNVFTALVETESLLLLRTDLSDTTDKQKAYLTATLLRTFATKAEFDRDLGLRQHYRKLAHPALVDQLRPYLLDKEAYHAARNAAMEIAAACEIKELTYELISLALNQSEAHYLRLSAAHAATNLAHDSQLARLRPIAFGEAGDDPEDRLKAAVIPALWPTYISTKEIFEVILQTQNVGCLGDFRYTPKDFVKHFSVGDLIIALQWIIDNGKNYPDFEIDHLKDTIMMEAWHKLDDPHVLSAFAEMIWSCLERYESIFNRRGKREIGWLEQDDGKRRVTIMSLLVTHSKVDSKRDLMSLVAGENRIILPRDATWLVECYRTNISLSLRTKLAKCIDFFLRFDADATWLDAVVSVAYNDTFHSESPLAEIVDRFMAPILLDSETALILKEQHAQQLERERKKVVPLDPPPPGRVTEALHEFEAGKNDAWMRLWWEMSLPDDAIHYSWNFENITKFPGWQRATSTERSSILRCAEAWLRNECLTQEEIFPPDNSISYSYAATYLAIRLLFDESPQSLTVVTPETWSRWAVWLVAYRFDNANEQRQGIIKLAYEKASKAVLDTFHYLISRDIGISRRTDGVSELAAIWDTHVAALLHEFLIKPSLTHEQIKTLLDVLLEHNDETAFEFACRLVKATDNPTAALVAAKALVAHQPRRSWQFIWEMICDNVSFGENLLLDLAYYSNRDSSILISLTEPEIAKLYIWLEEHFPVTKDNCYHGKDGKVHSVTARDRIGYIRDHCPSYLSGLGTQGAIDALHRICDQFPDRDWLKYMLNEARKSFRKTSLQALSPAKLITYTHRPDARLARSSAELKVAVLGSLERLQEKLHGQTPLAPFLWDLSDNGKSGRPKSEDRVTDFVKFFLERDLPTFVIDREVQIRNLKEHGIGERTDLKVEAKNKDGRSISVIIENKGCWNKELLTAMQNQLSDRYLKLASEACGIYLVGWFHCDRWKRNSNSNCIFKGSKEELLAKLNIQINSRSEDKGKLSVFVLDATY